MVNAAASSAREFNTVDFGNGLKFVEQTPGDGKTFPHKGDKLTVHYTLRLTNDALNIIDSSRDRGKPFTFTIGTSQVIKGWDQGVMQMSLGQRGTLFVPSALGYGKRGVGDIIPRNADLTFEVEVLSLDGGPSI